MSYVTLFQCSLGRPVCLYAYLNISGIGWAMVLISAMVCAYYNTIIMYSIYYMMVSFVTLDTQLPWAKCDPEWSTDLCRSDPYPNFATMTNETERVHEALSKYLFW
jgi:solute carrier family 6 amino acid transporter-like protein 5/7/9/14